MFGILLNKENLPEIMAHQKELPGGVAHLYADVYLNNPKFWYYVRGYVDESGKVVDWACFPEYIFVETFDYDTTKIKTEFTQMVRKESP